ncbi:MAG: vWA domain-containing protein [Dysgonomonas sp.]
MKKFIVLWSMLFAFMVLPLISTSTTVKGQKQVAPSSRLLSRKPQAAKIQVAILLDTSSSMDGLIEQAKSRLWNIVNTLTTLKYNGHTPQIEIALYEYGNNGIKTNDYIRQVMPLSSDLDLLSEKLFALATWGGSEYCGAVIDKAVKRLDWGNNDADMKLIYIAGNEPFTQGSISYKAAIANALENDIYINTIHCGDANSGINGMWRDGAIRGKGKFFNINHNAKVRYIDTPYDDRISICNQKLNETYISYGAAGFYRFENQAKQDANAMSISKSNYAERAVSKTKAVYDNSSWDLVDLAKNNTGALKEIKQSDLPKELQNKSTEELQKAIAEKEVERANIQKEINELAKKRQEYIDEQVKKGDSAGDDLGKAINESVLAFANKKGYIVSK